MLGIGFVSDELALDFREAVRIGLGWGVRKYEIRNVRSGRVPVIDRPEQREIEECVASEGVEITAVSPGIFKCPVKESKKIEHELHDVLPRCMEFAMRCGARIIHVFGFSRSGSKNRARAAAYLHEAAQIVSHEGLILAIENEAEFLCDSGTNTRDILLAGDHPALRVNWDPANAFGCGESEYPDGYRAVLPYIAGVHVKDTVLGSSIACVPVGEGKVDWHGQIAALVADRPVEHVIIETHCEPLVGMSRLNLERVGRLIEAAEATFAVKGP